MICARKGLAARHKVVKPVCVLFYCSRLDTALNFDSDTLSRLASDTKLPCMQARSGSSKQPNIPVGREACKGAPTACVGVCCR